MKTRKNDFPHAYGIIIFLIIAAAILLTLIRCVVTPPPPTPPISVSTTTPYVASKSSVTPHETNEAPLPELPKTDLGKLQYAIAHATSSSYLPVIIEFYKTPGDAEKTIVENFGGAITHSFHIIPAISAFVPKENILALFKQESVKTIQIDHHGYKRDTSTTSTPESTAVPIQTSAPTAATSRPVSIAVIDSGVDYTHPDIRLMYAGGYNFVDKNDDPMDDNGHGTHVAGLIANTIYHLETISTSTPTVKLYALKVLDEHAVGYFSNIIAALEWSVDHHIDIVNNSYGEREDPGSLVEDAFNAAEKSGTLIIAAAGNSGECTGTQDTIEFPARYSSVVAVGAIDAAGKRPCFSSTGPQSELVAPGVLVWSTQKGGGYVPGNGTSVSTPDVTAIAAFILSIYPHTKSGATMTSFDVRKILQQSAYDLGSPGKDAQYGYGLVDAEKAFTLASTW